MAASERRRVDWPSTFAEVGLILLGLLLAFAADRAWEARQQSVIADSYVARLITDFEATAVGLQESIDRQQEILDASRRALNLIGARNTDSIRAQLPVLLPTVFDGWVTRLTTATLDEMTATGQLELLPSDVRRQLAEFESFRRGNFATTEAAEAEQWIHRTQPFLNDRVSPDLYVRVGDRQALGIPDSPFPYDPIEVATDPELWSVVTHRIIYTELRKTALEDLQGINREVIERLAGGL